MQRLFGLVLALALSSLAASAWAQGVTTSSMRGVVRDEAGEPLPGANVVATHMPSGTQYGTATNIDGVFFIPNMRVGGPYQVRITFVGYQPYVRENIMLRLGETFVLNVQLSPQVAELEAVEVVAAAGVFDATRTGVGVNLDETRINTAPTVGRDLADFVRLVPQAYVENDDDDGPAISIAGQNNRYNAIFIDGAVNNDVFGLSAQGTNGGQTGAPPISLDAIEQFQINISPYDVTQSGFTGGAINAVTRSGTNRYEGSVYYFLRNEMLAGLTPKPLPGQRRERLPDFINQRYGFRLGGPILRNKLFFFVNAELLRAETPQPYVPGEYLGESANRLDEIRTVLREELGYDPGTYGTKAATLDDNKLLLRLDWNINPQHKLSARLSYSASDNRDEFDSGPFQIVFLDRTEVFPNRTLFTTVELNSVLGSSYANKLIVGYTRVRDDRDIDRQPFPTVDIADGQGDILLGPEPFSTANMLNQDIFTITNNFNWFKGRHTFTFGAHFEYYDIANLFIPFNFGWYFYDSVDDFLRSVCAASAQDGQVVTPTCQAYGLDVEPANTFFMRGFSLIGSDIGDEADNIGAFKAFQIGFYVQDEYQVNDRLRLTAGLRFDIPKITTRPRYAPDVFETTLPAVSAYYDLEGARPGQTPRALLYISPRIGFNYDLSTEKRRAQLRGGAGIFLGRVPFVWPGGMFLNNGVNTGFLFRGGPVEFRPDPRNALTPSDFGIPSDALIPSGRLEIFARNFRYPRVFRTSLGIDYELPYGIIATFEGQFTKTLSNILVKNINLKPTNTRLTGPDNRPIYGYGFDSRGRVDRRASLIDSRYSSILLATNTSKGYTYDVTVQLQKEFGNWLYASLSYTYGDAFAVNDGTSSQIVSLWRYNEHVNGANNIGLARSDFSIGHRILGQLTYRRTFFKRLATTITLFYTGESGRPFSYTIGRSRYMVGEGPEARDVSLFYVPRNANELVFKPYTSGGRTITPEEQAAALEAFIEGNPYLRKRRGKYAERNGDRTPFESVLDLKIAQEVFTNIGGRRHKVELTLDIFNFTNLLGELFGAEWGIRYNRPFQYAVVQFEEFRDPENGDLTPVYTFRLMDIKSKKDLFDRLVKDFGTYSSRWQMQLGLRYTF